MRVDVKCAGGLTVWNRPGLPGVCELYAQQRSPKYNNFTG
jgi:hypothetical protein